MTADAQNTARPDKEPLEAGEIIRELSLGVADYWQKMADYLFDLSCLDGLGDLVSRHSLPSKFFSGFRKALDLYDESVHYLLGRMRQRGFNVQCRLECPHCCLNMPSGVGIAELVYLYQAMHDRGIAPRFFRRCLEAAQTWSAACRRPRQASSASANGESDREGSLEVYFHSEHPCPFLVNDMCQVYSCRPLACRMHFSLTSPHWCHPSHFQHPYARNFNLEPSEKVWETLERLDQRFRVELSDTMVCGLLELTVNVMRFEKIRRV